MGSDDRQAFYRRIDALSMTPLWEVLHNLVPPTPTTPCVPAMWRYESVRPFLIESGSLISAREAVRRVLVLENPGLRGASAITHSLYAGLQLILPGEIAPSHRHTQSALRFIVEGEGAYTAVDGERVTMHPGDFIVTPAWTWHDHGHPGKGPVVWLDGLDIPLVRFFDAGFMENDTQDMQPLKDAQPSPLSFAFPYAKARAALDKARAAGLDPCHGARIQYLDPATGKSPMPTIGAFLQWMPRGFSGRSYRSTDATVYCAFEGCGRTQVGEQVQEWGPRDVFVAPSWQPVVHHAAEDAVLFSFSDRPAQQALGLWRELAASH